MFTTLILPAPDLSLPMESLCFGLFLLHSTKRALHHHVLHFSINKQHAFCEKTHKHIRWHRSNMNKSRRGWIKQLTLYASHKLVTKRNCLVYCQRHRAQAPLELRKAGEKVSRKILPFTSPAYEDSRRQKITLKARVAPVYFEISIFFGWKRVPKMLLVRGWRGGGKFE